MGIFDNVSSVILNNKEVESILCLDNNKYWYQKSSSGTLLEQPLSINTVFPNLRNSILNYNVEVYFALFPNYQVTTVEEYESAYNSINDDDLLEFVEFARISGDEMESGEFYGLNGETGSIIVQQARASISVDLSSNYQNSVLILIYYDVATDSYIKFPTMTAQSNIISFTSY